MISVDEPLPTTVWFPSETRTVTSPWRIGAAGNGADIVLHQFCLGLGQFLDGLERGVNRPVSQLGGAHGAPSISICTVAVATAKEPQVTVIWPSLYLSSLARLIGHDGVQILVEDLFLQVGQCLEALKGPVQLLIISVRAPILPDAS